MELNEQVSSIYKYCLSNFDILYPDGTRVSVPSSFVNFFYINKSFDYAFFPIFNINFNVRTVDYYKILKNKDKVKFRIRLQKYKSTSDGIPPAKEDVFNGTFCTFIEDSSPFFDEELYKKDKQARGIPENDMSPEEVSNRMELYLFKEEDLNTGKKIVNSCYGNLTVTDMLMLILSNGGYKGKVLMSPCDNNVAYSEILIPPLPTIGAIKYLEEVYDQFYNEGSVLFFDLDRGYFLRKKASCTAFAPQEYNQTVISIREAGDAKSNQISCVNDIKEKKFYINANSDLVAISSLSMTEDQLDGSNLMIIDPESGNVMSTNTDTTKRGSGNTQVLFQKQVNSRSHLTTQASIKENSKVLNVKISDIDIEAFTPNKNFTIKFMDKQTSGDLSGSYRLSSLSLKFIRKTEDFTCSCDATFKK